MHGIHRNADEMIVEYWSRKKRAVPRSPQRPPVTLKQPTSPKYCAKNNLLTPGYAARIGKSPKLDKAGLEPVIRHDFNAQYHRGLLHEGAGYIYNNHSINTD
jgi:hypothetical protein